MEAVKQFTDGVLMSVDICKENPTYGQHLAVGFAVLSEAAVFQYKCDNFYAPQADGGNIIDYKMNDY